MAKTIYFDETDYSKFKIIDGNREVSAARIGKIKESIRKCGFIGAIVVNENLEVIDGQGRLKACEELGVPIDYIVEEGLTIDDCIEMNISATPWNLNDYINSYADRGNKNYIRLRDFVNSCKYGFATSTYAVFRSAKANKTNQIKNGTLIVTDEDIERAKEIVDFWSNFDEIATNRPTEFYAAIAYCYDMECVDNYRLINKVKQFERKFENIANITDAIDVIEDCYNDRKRGDHVYIETEYFKYLNSVAKGVGDVAKIRNERKD